MAIEELQKLCKDFKYDLNVLPGLKYSNHAKRFFPIIIALLFLLFLLINNSSMVSNIDLQFLLKKSIGTKATIVDVDSLGSSELLGKKEFTYVFTVDSIEYQNKVVLEGDSKNYLKIAGDTLGIEYLLSNPDLNKLETEKASFNYVNFELLFIFGLVILLVVVYGANTYRNPRIQYYRSIYKNGQCTKGYVKSISNESLKDADGVEMGDFKVHFAFDLNNRSISSEQIVTNRWLINQIKPGHEITVIYDLNHPSKCFIAEAFVD